MISGGIKKDTGKKLDIKFIQLFIVESKTFMHTLMLIPILLGKIKLTRAVGALPQIILTSMNLIS